MQNLAGRFHIFEGPALKPHAAVRGDRHVARQAGCSPEVPKQDRRSAGRTGALRCSVSSFGGIGSLIGHGLQRILLVPRTEKAAGQQQAQGESHCIRTDRPIPENRTDSLAAPWTKYGYEHDGIMNSGATDVKMIISTGRSVSPAQTGSLSVPTLDLSRNRLRKKETGANPLSTKR